MKTIAVIANTLSDFENWARGEELGRGAEKRVRIAENGDIYIFINTILHTRGISFDGLLSIIHHSGGLSWKERERIEQVRAEVILRLKNKIQEKNLLFKSIRLYPSVWRVDVYVGKDDKRMLEKINHRHGLDLVYDEEAGMSPSTQLIESEKDSTLNGETRIVLCLKSLEDTITIVHEIIHVLHYFAKATGAEMGYDTQEWQALFTEYIFEQVTDKEGYKKI